MCDVCIIRNRAYSALTDDNREAVDEMSERWEDQLQSFREAGDVPAYEACLIEFGRALDIMLDLKPAFTREDLGEFADLFFEPVEVYESDPEPRAQWWRFWSRSVRRATAS